MFKSVIRFLTRCTHHLFPATCLLCGQLSGKFSICEPCLRDLPILPKSCDCCAVFLPDTSTALCGACQSAKPSYERIFALFPYSFPITALIAAIKFKQQLVAAHALGTLMAQQLNTLWYPSQPLPDLIVPVPLHPQRLKERGYNQALELARPISKQFKLPIDRFGLKKIKQTLPQTALSGKQRRENVKAAFECQRNYDNLCIALMDDVITTGATISEISTLLMKNGAKSVHVWCCARRG